MGALTHNGEVLQSLPANASQINFDKTGTNLNSTQVENAIKEVNTKVNTNTNDITQLKSGLTNIVKTVTETLTTNSNNWLVFPAGRTILSATIGDYDAVVLTYADGFGYMSRYHFMESTTTPQFEMYAGDTDYTVRYSYI